VRAESSGCGDFERVALPLLTRFITSRAGWRKTKTKAEDLVREAFTKAPLGFSSFAPSSVFRSWIFRILRKTFLTSRTGSALKENGKP